MHRYFRYSHKSEYALTYTVFVVCKFIFKAAKRVVSLKSYKTERGEKVLRESKLHSVDRV